MNRIKQIKEFKQQPYKLNPVILKEYDIRGQINKNLSLADAFTIGSAFGTYIKRKGGHLICVGYDGRTSSPSLAEALICGLTSTGINVNAIGLGPTPMLSFAIKDNPADAGIMVTGSHNPPDHNGFKMSTSSGPFYGDMIQELGKIAEEGNFDVGEGSVSNIDIKDKYVARLLRDIPPLKNMKIAWDCGNGASGEIIRRLIKKIPGDHILMFDEIDGSFPNHHPDPTVDENLKDLITTVKKEKCDVGIAFDGDADRVGAVDEQGNILRSDTLMTVYAKDVLTSEPPPINESISGVNPDKLWTILRRYINGTEALYGGADYRIPAAG